MTVIAAVIAALGGVYGPRLLNVIAPDRPVVDVTVLGDPATHRHLRAEQHCRTNRGHDGDC
jgi:hypothetical protein